MSRGKGYGRQPSQSNQPTMPGTSTGKRGSGWGRQPSQQAAGSGGAGRDVPVKAPGDSRKGDDRVGPGVPTPRKVMNTGKSRHGKGNHGGY